jgi:hypothetical protein
MDCDGEADPGEPGLSGWAITLTNLSTGTDTTLTTDNDGYYYFINLPAGMYSIKETQQNGWAASEPLDSFVLGLEKNSTRTVNFLNCKLAPTNCGREFAELERDSICCGYSFRLINPIASSPALTAVTYIVSGGVVDAITTLGCTPSSSTVAPGSTTGTLTFTACNTNIDFNVAATATNASGIINMMIITEHGSGTKCTTEVSFTCPRQGVISCSELLMTQVYDNPAISNITNREFEIHNLKNPMSEISHIVLTPINIAGPLIGIDPKFKMINTQTTWTEMDPVSSYWVGPYVLLPNTPSNSTFCSGTHASVQVDHSGILLFTIGHDATGGNYWNGGLRVDIIHCDGDTCTDSVMWNTPQISGLIGITKSVKPGPKLTASSLILANPGNLGTRQISTIQVVSKTPQSNFFAVSGGYLFALDKSSSDKIRVSSSMTNPKTAVFHLSKPVSASDFSRLDSINIVLTYATGIDPELEVIYFDENRNKIGIDKASVALSAVTAVQQVPQLKIVSASPNPASAKMTITYSVNKRQAIVLDVVNPQGTVVTELVRSQVNGGEHNVVLDAGTLPAGTYILRLTGENEVATLPIVVIH